MPAESNGWNPFIDQWSDSGTMVGSSFIEPLAVQDNDGRPQPWLAERWEPNADSTTWDITVRPGVVFHDGTPLDAGVVKKSLDASFQSGLYQVALGPLYDRVEVIGPLTVRVHLKLRWAQYPTSLVHEWILAPAMLDRRDGGVLNPIGTGPFVFERWVQGKSVAVRRFDRYWRRDERGEQLPYLDGIEFRSIVDDGAREEGLRDRDIDVALSPASDIAVNLAGEFDVIKDYTGQRTYVMLNTAEGTENRGNPFRNVHARRALAYATDRQQIAQRVGQGVQMTPYGYRPDSVWAPDGADGTLPYDPEKAKAEIEIYKRETRSSKLSFTFTAIIAEEIQAITLALKEQWAKVGITATIDSIEPVKLPILAALGQYQAMWFRLHDFPDPDQMNFYYSSSTVAPVGKLSLNFTRYTSPRLDGNLRVIRESVDQQRRKVANDDLIRETNEQVVNLWLYDTPESLVASRHVKGLDKFRTHAFCNPLPKPWLSEAWLDR